MLVTLEELSKDALVRIITEPKNALGESSTRSCLMMDHVDLEITDRMLSRRSQSRLWNARQAPEVFRGIMEKIMTNIMYEVPSRDDVKKCIITRETVEAEQDPELVLS